MVRANKSLPHIGKAGTGTLRNPRTYVAGLAVAVAVGVLATAVGVVRWSSPVGHMERTLEAFSMPGIESERTVAVDDRLCLVTCMEFEVTRLIAVNNRETDSELCARVRDAVTEWARGQTGGEVQAEFDSVATPCKFTVDGFARDGWCAGAGVLPSDEAQRRDIDVEVRIGEC